MTLAVIFQDLELLNDFQQSAVAAILFFKMKFKFCTDMFPWPETFPANLVKISLLMNEILRFT